MPKQRPVQERIDAMEQHVSLLKQAKRVEMEKKKLSEMRKAIRDARKRK